MKKLLFSVVVLFITSTMFSQSFDINPWPGEDKPLKTYNKLPLGTINNWGEDYVLPDSLLTRLTSQAKYNVIVKIFDTGAGYTHQHLSNGVLSGSNYCSPAGSPTDAQGHSTHVAGIIGSSELGMLRTLVANGKVKLKPVKVLNDQGSGNFGWIDAAIKSEDNENKNYIANNTFVVINMSLGGGTGKISTTEAALKASRELGVIYCVASGNSGTLGVSYPGNSEHVIGVGSLDNNLQRSSYSQFGPEVWNGMPGRGINSCYLNNSYAVMSGTSMATPFETSIVAIALSVWGKPLANVDSMKLYLAWAAKDLPPSGKDNETGWGVLLVKSILDKNPKDRPINNNPPNPNPNPNPPTHVSRHLQFSIDGNFKMVWGIVQSSSLFKIKKPTLLNDVVNPSAYSQLTVTRIVLQSNNSKLYSEDEYKKVTDNLTWFFTNRGLMLTSGSDFSDATYWSSYFLDMILKTQKDHDIDVISIEAKDEKGNEVLFDKTLLRKY